MAGGIVIARTRTLAVATTCSLLVLGGAQAGARAQVSPQTGWLRVLTPHFDIVGPSPAEDLQGVGERLERFRQALTLLLPRADLAAARPARIIVFPTDAAYAPFKPMYEGDTKPRVQGHAVGGAGRIYMVLTTENDASLGVVYHEYVHVLVHSTLTSTPAWLDEGLAEFYSTFKTTPDGGARIGDVLLPHLRLLRQQSLLPLSTLTAVDHQSPLYNEGDKASMFYAQSWALVHYLLLGPGSGDATRLARFAARLTSGESLERACAAELQTTPDDLQLSLGTYVRQDVYAHRTVALPAAADTPTHIHAVPPADAHGMLADVLHQMGRPDDAEAQARAALALDPEHADAHAVLGQVLADSGRSSEARVHLERAIRSPDASWLTHYTYATVLLADRPSGRTGVSGPEDAAIERSLRRAIELNPSSAEPRAQLAWLKAQDPRTMDEAGTLADEALARAPADETVLLLRAQVYVNARRYSAARPLLERLTGASDADARRQAAEILARMDALAAATAGRTADDVGLSIDRQMVPDERVVVFRAIKSGERRLAGWLAAVECSPEGVVFSGRSGPSAFRLRARRFEDVELVTYSERRRGVRCGERFTSTVVVVSFVADRTGSPILSGRLVAIEFPPPGYRPRDAAPK